MAIKLTSIKFMNNIKNCASKRLLYTTPVKFNKIELADNISNRITGGIGLILICGSCIHGSITWANDAIEYNNNTRIREYIRKDESVFNNAICGGVYGICRGILFTVISPVLIPAIVVGSVVTICLTSNISYKHKNDSQK